MLGTMSKVLLEIAVYRSRVDKGRDSPVPSLFKTFGSRQHPPLAKQT